MVCFIIVFFIPNKDIIVKGKFIGMEMTVECDSPFAYRSVKHTVDITTNNQNVVVNNTSSSNNYTLPLITIILGDNNTIASINNTTLNNEFKWIGLNEKEKNCM